MPPFLSTYLNAVRVLAALVVVLRHFGSQRIGGGLLWQATPYGAQAVDVFFVLSGYVIAYVAAERERGKWNFLTARLARLYSVMVPALLITLALDALGQALTPTLYGHLPAYTVGHPPLLQQALGGLLFFNQAWSLDQPVGSNLPWWSMGYEVPYYLAFGLAWFGPRGIWRVLLAVLVLAAAGPKVVALAPIWAMGAMAWHVHRMGWVRDSTTAANLALLPVAAWIVIDRFSPLYPAFSAPPPFRPETLQDLAVGTLFAIHLLGMGALSRHVTDLPPRFSRLVAWLAGRSFTLYLLHYPVLLCLRAAQLRYAPALSPLFLLPAALLIVLAVAQVTEQRKLGWRRLFAALVRRLVLRQGQAPAGESAAG